uniref:Putative secreted salivary protein n=1 Tax=Xenopsylla cheopis TaxID=163159 RepID=A2IA74_XENCH|nr:putative secreted salivary protein [Xenopsylla cheopis]
MRLLFAYTLILALLQITFAATANLKCQKDNVGDYFIPNGCQDDPTGSNCENLCKSLCTKVKNPFGICGVKEIKVDPKHCVCIEIGD